MAEDQIKPIAAVSVCVVRAGKVLLVKRGKRLGRNLWSLPGGHVELGEPVREAALRELKEETDIDAELIRLLDCIDVINRTAKGDVVSHYILTVFGARWQAGEAIARDDAIMAQWTDPETFIELQMTPGTAALIERALPSLID